eukprot:3177831-Pyramimonas_sp.AAC.1
MHRTSSSGKLRRMSSSIGLRNPNIALLRNTSPRKSQSKKFNDEKHRDYSRTSFALYDLEEDNTFFTYVDDLFRYSDKWKVVEYVKPEQNAVIYTKTCSAEEREYMYHKCALNRQLLKRELKAQIYRRLCHTQAFSRFFRGFSHEELAVLTEYIVRIKVQPDALLMFVYDCPPWCGIVVDGSLDCLIGNSRIETIGQGHLLHESKKSKAEYTLRAPSNHGCCVYTIPWQNMSQIYLLMPSLGWKLYVTFGRATSFKLQAIINGFRRVESAQQYITPEKQTITFPDQLRDALIMKGLMDSSLDIEDADIVANHMKHLSLYAGQKLFCKSHIRSFARKHSTARDVNSSLVYHTSLFQQVLPVSTVGNPNARETNAHK